MSMLTINASSINSNVFNLGNVANSINLADSLGNVDSVIETFKSEIEGNSLAISVNVNSIEALTDENETNLSTINSLKNSVASNLDSINNLTVSVDANNSLINNVKTSVTANTNSINSLTTSVASNTTSINNLATSVASNKSSINSLSTSVASNTTSIANLNISVNSNTTSIANLLNSVNSNSISINNLATSVASNTTLIGNLVPSVDSNTNYINNLASSVNSNTMTINNVRLTTPYLYNSTTGVLEPPYNLRSFIYPFSFGSITSYNYIPNNYIYVCNQNNSISINFRDEFTVAKRFRCTIGGSGLTSSAYNLLYYTSGDPYLSSLATNDPVYLEIMISLPNVISFLVNGKIIAQTLFNNDFLYYFSLRWGVGGIQATPNNIGNLIVKSYATLL